jgi:hypothetical protein
MPVAAEQLIHYAHETNTWFTYIRTGIAFLALKWLYFHEQRRLPSQVACHRLTDWTL